MTCTDLGKGNDMEVSQMILKNNRDIVGMVVLSVEWFLIEFDLRQVGCTQTIKQ
jgi:hypothetical protein